MLPAASSWPRIDWATSGETLLPGRRQLDGFRRLGHPSGSWCCTVDAELEVQVRPGRPARGADGADAVALVDALALATSMRLRCA
jgi:hypothetical protein